MGQTARPFQLLFQSNILLNLNLHLVVDHVANFAMIILNDVYMIYDEQSRTIWRNARKNVVGTESSQDTTTIPLKTLLYLVSIFCYAKLVKPLKSHFAVIYIYY